MKPPQVMADQHKRQLQFLLEIREKLDEPLLPAAIDAGGRLIEQQQSRPRRQRPGDEHALQLSAGE